MDLIFKFFSMGGYAVFVWPSYLLVAIVLAVLMIISRRRLKQRLDDLAQCEKTGNEGEIEEEI